ncbi:uncharacterized protein BDW70DRAFT_138233 [Aspergillus foveolatus]|uniref:uncharacterized protein n=1 Tax=Aspergillus foveolatus TaxID=210207 RepID=UPI003CCE1350
MPAGQDCMLRSIRSTTHASTRQLRLVFNLPLSLRCCWRPPTEKGSTPSQGSAHLGRVPYCSRQTTLLSGSSLGFLVPLLGFL